MTEKFDIDKIVNYLQQHKADLSNLYNWNAKIDRLVELEVLTKNQVEEINKLKPYEKELLLKKMLDKN